MIKNYEKLFAILEYEFTDIKLLEEAFTHNSMAKKHRTYQRLEFLGDRVLGLVVAEMLYKKYPSEQEGPLAKRHAALVCEETLAKIAQKIEIANYLIISESEKNNLDNPSMLADSCEALIGALHLVAGFEAVKNFIEKYWTDEMEQQIKPPIDAKSELQEWAQGNSYNLPKYEVINMKGSEHEPEFEVKASIEGLDKIGYGFGKTKKLAEQNAAKDLLGKIK